MWGFYPNVAVPCRTSCSAPDSEPSTGGIESWTEQRHVPAGGEPLPTASPTASPTPQLARCERDGRTRELSACCFSSREEEEAP